MVTHYYMGRDGKVRAIPDEELCDIEKGVNIGYIRRLVKHAEPNRMKYVSLALSGKSEATLRMAFNKVANEQGVIVRTIVVDGYIGFVKVKVEEAFV